MAIKMHSDVRTDAELVLISRFDSAIDWEASFPELPTLEEKVAEFEKTFDPTNLVFIDGETPTFFVFRDPRISTVANSVNAKLTGIKSMISGGDSDDDVVIVWNVLGIGYRENGETIEYARDSKKNIAYKHMQPLSEVGTLRELGLYLLSQILKVKSLPTVVQKK